MERRPIDHCFWVYGNGDIRLTNSDHIKYGRSGGSRRQVGVHDEHMFTVKEFAAWLDEAIGGDYDNQCGDCIIRLYGRFNIDDAVAGRLTGGTIMQESGETWMGRSVL